MNHAGRNLRLLFCLIVTGASAVGTARASAAPVINEALANERGSAVAGEWVELVNPATQPIDLSDWRFVDGKDTTSFPTNSIIPPGGFAVLARRLTDDPGGTSFENIWGNGSGVWGDHSSESFPAFQATMALRNRADTVYLIEAITGAVVSSLWWSSDPGDGISWERLYPGAPDIDVSFRAAIDQAGSTPGAPNSILPPPVDLVFDSLVVDELPLERPTPSLLLTAHLSNGGFDTANTTSIVILDDFSHDGAQNIDEPSVDATAGPIPPLASTTISVIWDNPAPGRHRFVGAIAEDENPVNDTAAITIDVPFIPGALLITEFLANPTIGGPEEWAELLNPTDQPIALTGLRFGDSLGAQNVTDDPMILRSMEYAILAESESAFRAFYPDFIGLLLQVPGWRGLNNSGDRLVLTSIDGFVIDSVSFRDVHDHDRSSARVRTENFPHYTNLWGHSADPTGSSPGRENQQSDYAAAPLTLSVEPRVFAAAADQTARITLTLPLFSEVSVTVFDVNGQRVRRILDRQPLATSEVGWNGRDDAGRTLPPGPYVILVETFPDRDQAKAVIAIAPPR